VPEEGDISYADLAKALEIDETNLTRLIRHAMTNRIFLEPRSGYVAHSAASRVLKDDQQMVGWVGVCSSEFFQAAARTVESMQAHPGSQEPSESGYSLAHCPGKPMFSVLGNDPIRAKRFGAAMVSLTGGEGYEMDYVLDNYPWGELPDGAVIVDVRPLSPSCTPHAVPLKFPLA
jgi:hypothetical protein